MNTSPLVFRCKVFNIAIILSILGVQGCASTFAKPDVMPVATVSEQTLTASATISPVVTTANPIPTIAPSLTVSTSTTPLFGNLYFSTITEIGTSEKIFLINTETKQSKLLLTLPPSYAFPVFSPDGEQIAVLDFRDEIGVQLNGNTHLTVMSLDNSNTTELGDSTDSTQAIAWSTTGEKLAIVKTNETSGLEIYIVNTDGANLAQLTNDGRHFAKDCLSWSPDGMTIAYGAQDVTARADLPYYIDLVKIDGSHQQHLSNNLSARRACPIFSPDGTRLAIEVRQGGDSHIYVMNVSGTDLQQLTKGSGSDESPQWSPDGAWIAFTSDRSGARNIYVMAADGSNVSQITTNTFDSRLLAWLP